MDSFFDSPTQTAHLPPNDKNCEQLFDEIFHENHNQQNEDEEFNVKRPIHTYQKHRNFVKKVVKFYDEDEHDNDDDGDDDYFDELEERKFDGPFDEKIEKPKRRQQPRKKKLAYPNVSKDAVLEAFNKAVESHELPDFDEIGKFPLSIVEEKPQKRTRRSIRKSQQPKTSKIQRKKSTAKISSTVDKENALKHSENHIKTRSTKTPSKGQSNKKNALTEKTNYDEQPITTKISCIIDKENALAQSENHIKTRSTRTQSKDSTNKKNILTEKTNNAVKRPITTKIVPVTSKSPLPEKSLFDLDESCIVVENNNINNDFITTKNFSNHNMTRQKIDKIKSSTPFASNENKQQKSINQSNNQRCLRPRRTKLFAYNKN